MPRLRWNRGIKTLSLCFFEGVAGPAVDQPPEPGSELLSEECSPPPEEDSGAELLSGLEEDAAELLFSSSGGVS